MIVVTLLAFLIVVPAVMFEILPPDACLALMCLIGIAFSRECCATIRRPNPYRIRRLERELGIDEE